MGCSESRLDVSERHRGRGSGPAGPRGRGKHVTGQKQGPRGQGQGLAWDELLRPLLLSELVRKNTKVLT